MVPFHNDEVQAIGQRELGDLLLELLRVLTPERRPG
jgi:hypothetical protein